MGQVIALTTDDRVAFLRAAWISAQKNQVPLREAIEGMLADANDRLSQDVNSAASNSHSATTNQPGSNRITDQETVRAWNQILSALTTVRKYLLACCKYGLDTFAVQAVGVFPTPLPAALDAAARVMLDDSSQWADACEAEEIDATTVIGVAVDDGASYLWLLLNPDLLRTTNNVTETRGDYSSAIIGRGGATW